MDDGRVGLEIGESEFRRGDPPTGTAARFRRARLRLPAGRV
ncbi:MAG TPA: hypothetical protein PLD43_05240 [Anaerolineae bacterium]|nr:hypothetical protein [Anaerolineae bacterium]